VPDSDITDQQIGFAQATCCGIKRRLAFALSLTCLVAPASARAQNAYITNAVDDTVSVIDTATNTVVGAPITVGQAPIAFGLFIQRP
jgi:YVTN family beta-propeller protein